MNELLCVYVVYGKNQWLMPFLAYSILSAYPTYFIRFILLDELNHQVNKMMEILKLNGYVNFNIVPKKPIFFQAKYEKFLLEENWFRGFDYAWIGNINMLHFSESPSWLEKELKYSDQINLPFYNTHKNQIMSACHFIQVKPYFEKMNSVIQDFKLKTPLNYDPPEGYLLHNLLQKAFNIQIPNNIRDLHGIILEKHTFNKSPFKNQFITPLVKTLLNQVKNTEILQIFDDKKDYANMKKNMFI